MSAILNTREMLASTVERASTLDCTFEWPGQHCISGCFASLDLSSSHLGQASILAGHVQDAPYFGWRREVHGGDGGGTAGQPRPSHDWGGMVEAVQNHIKGLNFKYRTDLRSKKVGRKC